MSGISAPRRLRTKTSDLAEFFRGGSSSSQQSKSPRVIDNSVSTPSMMLEVPGQVDDNSSKKKITRIPLFGRSRKKSTHSASERPFAAASTSLVRESTDVTAQSSQSSRPTSSSDRRPSEPSVSPTTSKAQDSGVDKAHPPSLTSKLAAHFSHARTSKILRISETESAPVSLVSTSQAPGLVPPTPRSSSFESGSSRNSKARSTTPRPNKPTITVSPSPDLSEFKDLFVKEEPLDASSATPNTQSSPPASPRTRIPSEQPIYPRRGQTPASAIAAAVRHRRSPSLTDDRPPSTSSKNSRQTTDSDKSQDGTASSTPRNSDHTDSPRPPVPEKDKVLPPSLQRRTSVATSTPSERLVSSPSIRSRTKSAIPAARTRPPTAPLPLPPPPTFSPPVPPDSPSISAKIPSRPTTSPKPVPKPIQVPITSPKQEGSPTFPAKDGGRRRAHTIGAVTGTPPQSPLSRTTVTRSDLDVISTTPTSPVRFSADALNIDLATAGELREALKIRNKEFEELSAYVLKMTQAHLQEVATLEKKIFLLEKEVIRRDKEITGLKYVINDEDTSAPAKPSNTGLINRSRFSTASSLTADSDQDATNRRSAPPGSYRRPIYQSDSGNESHANSGSESLRASQSGASGSESTNMNSKRLRRPYGLGESAYNLIRSGTRRSSKIPPSAAKGDADHRASASTMSVSPASSTSSLLPPSPSITMSSLSAIPEGTGSVGLKPSRYETSDAEDRRASRAAHRISTSSMASSSTAASSVYSTNIKRSRPTSIAQVLEKTPNMDDVLEKLRPFA
ncbi:hypothetical protein CVT24_000098 [Panaeolus cyanescens]|uniref:Uncharacterized protein n=1 Tax=Panaeolus cyanescens TaxID=181874 RepID=A0A409VRZ9_9AGAR|nr:hypothetical protein CVT24_000098 [Panaeolus cyanescens]